MLVKSGLMVAMGLVSSAIASATPVLLTFSGTITSSSIPGFTSGTPYSGEFRFDTTDPEVSSVDTSATYRFGVNDTFAIMIAGCTYSGSGPGSDAMKNTFSTARGINPNGFGPVDIFSGGIQAATSSCSGPLPNSIGISLAGLPGLIEGTSGVPFGLDLNKLVQPGYAGYGSNIFAAIVPHGFIGDFATIQSTVVPEPANGILLAAALGGIALRKRVTVASRR